MNCRMAALLLMAALGWGAPDGPARIERLEKSVLAPCCYKEPISRHQSDVVTRMKLDLRAWVAEGRSDEEILSTFRQRYGDKVVVRPEGDPQPLLFAVPWLAGLAGTILVLHVLRRWRRARAPVSA